MKTRNYRLLLATVCMGLLICLAALFGLNFNGKLVANAEREETTKITFEDGASIRLNKSSMGIRFSAIYSEDIYQLAEEGNVGMIIVPSQVLAGVGEQDYFSYIQTTYGKTPESVSTQFSQSQFTDNGNGTYTANGALVNIKDDNLLYTYQAVAYYYDATAQSYVYSQPSCTRSIAQVAKAAFEDNSEEALVQRNALIETVSALNAQFKSANKVATELVLESDLDAGFDLSNYQTETKTIQSVTLGTSALNVTDNKVEFLSDADKTKASAAYQDLTIAYADGTSLTFNAKLWSLIIDNETELRKANDYLVENGAWCYSINGYYKLNQDIALTSNWTATDAIASGTLVYSSDIAFHGVFDGDNHTISNFNTVNGEFVGLIRAMGTDAVVKNLTLVGASGCENNGGYVAGATLGGTFENVTVKVSVPAGESGAVFTGSGALLGQIGYGTTPINVKNVTLISTGTTTAYRNAAISYTYGNTTTYEHLSFENVKIVGFDSVMSLYYDKAISYNAETIYDITTLAQLQSLDFAKCGIQLMTMAEYESAMAINLGAFDVDTDSNDNSTLDIAQLVDGNITEVVLGSTNLTSALVDGKLSFVDATATGEAETLVIKTSTGNTYKAQVTVWSLLIDDEEDLRAFGSNYDNEVGSVTGYFKMIEDVTLSNYEGQTYSWTNADAMHAWLFHTDKNSVVFDGNGHTIKNFVQLYEAGLFTFMTEGMLVKDLTIEYGGILLSTTGGVIAQYTTGGTIENVTIKVTSSSYASLFGTVGGISGGRSYTQLNVKNVNVVAMEASASHVALGTITSDVTKEKFLLENVNIVNVSTLLVKSDATAVSDKTSLEETVKCTNVTIYATVAEYEATLA